MTNQELDEQEPDEQEPDEQEKPMDPDLLYIKSVWHKLTPWQRKKFRLRVMCSAAMYRVQRWYKAFAVKWIEIALRL